MCSTMADKVDTNPENVHLEEASMSSRENIESCIPLHRYVEELKSEHQSWKDLYQETKKEYEETFQKLKQNPLKLDWDSCADLLTEEEKVFLSDKPDYKRIKRDMKLLLEKDPHCADVVVETAMIMDRTLSLAKVQKDHVQRCIIEYSKR